jgi:protein N-terminal amidase
MLKWGEEISKKYECYTVMGYPEWCSSEEQIYNSAVVFNKSGKAVHNYRKSFLYETDEVWGCAEGPGFKTFELMDGVKACLGICMDLNPYKFKAPFNDFEFSGHCYRKHANLVICPMNWLHGQSPSIQESLDKDEKLDLAQKFQSELDRVKGEYVVNAEGSPIRDFEEKLDYNDLHTPDYHNLNYWLLRFFPFMNHLRKPFQFNGKITVVYCNRSGLEDKILYGGTSSIVQFNGSKGISGYQSIDLTNKSVDALGALGKGDEGILIREVDV